MVYNNIIGGLKFNLTELEKYSEDFSNKIKNFKNGDKSCDKTNTMVIIYPTSPYGKNNYNVQVNLLLFYFLLIP